MVDTKKVKEKDFIEIKYTVYANDRPFDSNIEEDLRKLSPDAKPEKTIICIGQKMLVPGLDRQLDGKEVGKECEVEVPCKEAFGERKREMIKIIPLKAFTEQKVNPQVGMMFTLDNSLVKIIAVSRARVTTDFNHPLACKYLKYTVTITTLVEDDKEKTEALLKVLLKFVPEFEVKDKIIIKGPKVLEGPVNLYKEKFKELIGKDVVFEEKEPEKKEESKLEDKLGEKPENKD